MQADLGTRRGGGVRMSDSNEDGKIGEPTSEDWDLYKLLHEDVGTEEMESLLRIAKHYERSLDANSSVSDTEKEGRNQ